MTQCYILIVFVRSFTVDEKIHLQLLYIAQASQVTIVLSGDKFLKHRQVCLKMHHCA